MPDAAPPSPVTEAWWTANGRQQVISQVTSITRPGHTEGRIIAETDTNLFQVSTGAAWLPFGGWGAWSTYTPTLANVTGGTVAGAYQQFGKTMFLNLNITAGTATGAGPITISLPGSATALRLCNVTALLNVGGATTSTVSARITAGGAVVSVYETTAGGSFAGGESVICSVNFAFELT